MPTVVNVTIRAKNGAAVAYSTSNDRADPIAFDDQTSTLNGTIYPFLNPATGLDEVDWYLDDVLYSTRTASPYDVEGNTGADANPFALSSLASGTHRLVAVLDRTDGRMEEVEATFTVASSPDVDEILCTTTIGLPDIQITPGGATPLSIAVGTTIGTPTVTTGTVNNAREGAGWFPRLDGGYPANDENLELLEDMFNRRFSPVREIVTAKTGGWGIALGNANGIMLDPNGIQRLRTRTPYPIILDLVFAPYLTTDGTDTPAARRTNFQKVANGDYDARYDEFINTRCIAGGWGTTSENLWLNILHEFDGQGNQNPAFINRGNVDVAVEAVMHMADFFHARLPNVNLSLGRLSAADTKYYLANGNDSGKTSLNALMDEFATHGPISNWIDGLYNDIYDRQSWSYLSNRMDEVYAYCVQFGLPFIVSEWGLATTATGGDGDNPTFITNMYDYFVAHPLTRHHCYFEGNQDNGMIENNFANSIVRYRQLFGNP